MKCVLFFLFFFVLPEDYKTSFNEGISLTNQKLFSEAIVVFKKSYELNKNSKTLYYISLCYYLNNEDSFAYVYARKALNELPRLDTIMYYNSRLVTISNKWILEQRFGKVYFKVIMSNEVKIPTAKTNNKLSIWYKGADASERMMSDYNYLQTISLPFSKGQIIDSCDSKVYFKTTSNDSVIGSKTYDRYNISW